MKNERKRLILFWLSFYSFGAWKIVGMTMYNNNVPKLNCFSLGLLNIFELSTKGIGHASPGFH